MLAPHAVTASQMTAVTSSKNIPVPDLQDLYGYWVMKKEGRGMPCRSDISPLDIVNMLPKIILIDVERDPNRFRFRLVGTEVVWGMGRDVTGKYLDEIASSSPIEERLLWLVRHKMPYYAASKLDWMGRGFQNYHVLGLPLGNVEDQVSMVMYGIDSYYSNAN